MNTLTPRIIVLGAGQQGKIIAEDLAQDFIVDVADINEPDTSVRWIRADLSSVAEIVALCPRYDMVVNALPSAIGGNATYIAANVGSNLVDLSFNTLDKKHIEAAVQLKRDKPQVVITDAGWAPGLSDLIVGRQLVSTRGYGSKALTAVKIYVGGVAHVRKQPFGYVNTWSLPDLQEEYTREARYLEKGEVRTAMPLLYPLETVDVNGFHMEAFITDGLRTLLEKKADYFEDIDVVEKTLRWPGHVEEVTPLIEDGTFISTLKERCSEGKDMALMKIVFEYGESDPVEYSMVHYGTKEMSAMTKLTSMSCCGFVRAVFGRTVGFNSFNNLLSGVKGLYSPSMIGERQQATESILDFLESRGVDVAGLRQK